MASPAPGLALRLCRAPFAAVPLAPAHCRLCSLFGRRAEVGYGGALASAEALRNSARLLSLELDEAEAQRDDARLRAAMLHARVAELAIVCAVVAAEVEAAAASAADGASSAHGLADAIGAGLGAGNGSGHATAGERGATRSGMRPGERARDTPEPQEAGDADSRLPGVREAARQGSASARRSSTPGLTAVSAARRALSLSASPAQPAAPVGIIHAASLKDVAASSGSTALPAAVKSSAEPMAAQPAYRRSMSVDAASGLSSSLPLEAARGRHGGGAGPASSATLLAPIAKCADPLRAAALVAPHRPSAAQAPRLDSPERAARDERPLRHRLAALPPI